MNISHEGAEKSNPEKSKSQGAQPKQKSRLARLSLAALGVVFGDISTPARYMPFESVSTVNTVSM